jgi:hypothetical protein
MIPQIMPAKSYDPHAHLWGRESADLDCAEDSGGQSQGVFPRQLLRSLGLEQREYP